MNPIPADTPMTATMAAAEWNIILGALQEIPYKVAAQIIPKLAQQLQARPESWPMNKPNGEADHATG